MNIIEIIGAVSGLASVILAVRQSWITWPIGLLNISMFIVLFYNERLYPDVFLHVVYLVLSIYGWAKWNPKTKLEVTLESYREFIILPVIGIGAYLSSLVLAAFTDAAYPFWDSLVTGLSLYACYLMARKVISCWLIYIISDFIAIGIYFNKGLDLTAYLYFIYLLLCIRGYLTWKHSLKSV